MFKHRQLFVETKCRDQERSEVLNLVVILCILKRHVYKESDITASYAFLLLYIFMNIVSCFDQTWVMVSLLFCEIWSGLLQDQF